jgi:hypothetical protein
MSSYRLPSTSVTILDNPRIISLGQSARIPAIVALGPSTRTVAYEAVQRSTGSTDYLSVYSTLTPATGVTISALSSISQDPQASINGLLISQGGVLYSTSSGSFGAGTGALTWNQPSTPESNVPVSGSVYYVKYTYNTPATQYDPYIASDKTLIIQRYGPEDVNDSILTIGGSLVLENGSPSVMLVQASGSTYNYAGYTAAIDKLKKKSNIEQIVILFPSGSVSRAQQETLLTYAISHVAQMNTVGRERGLICGSPSTYYTSDGFDVIGDTSTIPSYVYRANILKNQNIVYVAPSRAQRTAPDGVTLLELDGNFIAAAVAGVQCAQTKRSTPIQGQVVAGLSIVDEKWSDNEIIQLGAAGCLPVKSQSGTATIVDQLTTDPTSADTAEMSIISSKRLVQRSLRDGLENVYTSKGKVISPTMVSSVEATVASILQSLINDGELFAFGQINDPSTGETVINAKQDAQEPRQIDVTCSVKLLYPMKWIVVTTSLYV